MADISKITTIDGTTYNLKDSVARREPIESRTYTDVIGTANDNNGAGFFYMKLRASSYTDIWRVVVRFHITVPGNASNALYYDTESTMELWGYANTYDGYVCKNLIKSTSYRPVYYHSVFFVSQTGYSNNCGNWLGFNLIYSGNNTSASYKRKVVVDLLEYENCIVEFSDTLITPTNIPDRAAHTNWYSSSNTSYTNIDACNQGIKQTGDANTTTIHALYRGYGNIIADSALYRYQLLFHTDAETLTPLNNDSNVTGTTKTMLTDVAFDPTMPIYYYSSSTTVNAGAAIAGSALHWHNGSVDARYTFNCGSTLTAHKRFYLVVTPQSDGTCKLASTTPWAQTLPTTADGKWYILLGRAISGYQICLEQDHPIYEYDGGIVRVIPYKAITNAEIDAITG